MARDTDPAFNDPGAFLEAWIATINDHDLERVLSLYAQEAILIPTFSPHIIRARDKLREYFEQVFTRTHLGVQSHPNSIAVQPMEGALYVLSGVYSWRFDVDDEVLTFPSRFNFILDLSRAAPILHHHSSQVPRTLS